MDFDEYQHEERLAAYACQFTALGELGLDAAALAAVSQPDVARMASELHRAAQTIGPHYALMTPPLRGVALARMLTTVARLFELARQGPAAPGRAALEDPIDHLPELVPRIRSCARFLAGEIAVYAQYLAQDEAAATLGEDYRLAEQCRADHELARAIHDRDAAYAARLRAAPAVPLAGPAVPALADPLDLPSDSGLDEWAPGAYPYSLSDPEADYPDADHLKGDHPEADHLEGDYVEQSGRAVAAGRAGGSPGPAAPAPAQPGKAEELSDPR